MFLLISFIFFVYWAVSPNCVDSFSKSRFLFSSWQQSKENAVFRIFNIELVKTIFVVERKFTYIFFWFDRITESFYFLPKIYFSLSVYEIRLELQKFIKKNFWDGNGNTHYLVQMSKKFFFVFFFLALRGKLQIFLFFWVTHACYTGSSNVFVSGLTNELYLS